MTAYPDDDPGVDDAPCQICGELVPSVHWSRRRATICTDCRRRLEPPQFAVPPGVYVARKKEITH